jgi:enamine deaminase RidA (YjgF/YER057c/UK114 family)
MRNLRTFVAVSLIGFLFADALLAQKKRRNKNGEEEEITQVLEVPKDPPLTVQVETARLGFLSAPLSSKGLLSQQVKDGLKALRKRSRGAAIVKVRAFVSGTGDLRRVPAIVSEQYTDWKLPIPAVTVVRVGGLPQEGAQVALEAVTSEKKPVNPQGVAFFSGQQVTVKEALEKVEPLLRESVSRLTMAGTAAQVPAANMMRVTCFTSALGDYSAQRQHLAVQFPKAAVTVVQVLRGLSAGLVECEGVGRLTAPPIGGGPVKALNPSGLASSANYSQVVQVNAPKLVLTGSQQAFRAQESDVRLAFERLDKAIELGQGSLKRAIMTNYYPLTTDIMEKIRKIRFEFLDQATPPASTMLLFEGLPSMDASFEFEVVALP